jgi:hypothetical protein
MDWSVKSMLQETLRCLQKTEVDLAVDAEAVKHHVVLAIEAFDRLQGKCHRCWGKGVIKCVLCGGQGEMSLPTPTTCSRCKGCCIEQCPDCAGYGIS